MPNKWYLLSLKYSFWRGFWVSSRGHYTIYFLWYLRFRILLTVIIPRNLRCTKTKQQQQSLPFKWDCKKCCRQNLTNSWWRAYSKVQIRKNSWFIIALFIYYYLVAFYGLLRLFHSFLSESIDRWGENGSFPRKPPDFPQAKLGLFRIRP